jgi:murein DD-endopeptidase MepM/ murein hydrolase activator NlpD
VFLRRPLIRFYALLAALSLFLSGCTGLFSGVFSQDDPRLIIPVEPLYRLPLPRDRGHFLLVQGVGGAFSHSGDLTFAFDWAMPMKTPVLAARDGVVIAVRSEPDERNIAFENRIANFVRIRHDDGSVAVYAHLDTTALRSDVFVRAGDVIGLSGNTGYSTQPHLHFHVEQDGRSLPVAFTGVRDPGGIPRVGRLYQGK